MVSFCHTSHFSHFFLVALVNCTGVTPITLSLFCALLLAFQYFSSLMFRTILLINRNKVKREAVRKKKIIISAFLAMFLAMIHCYNIAREKRSLTRRAIVHPNDSAWTKLYHDGADLDFLALTGFNRAAFDELCGIIFENEEVNRRGRKMCLDQQAQVGLYLFYCCSTMSQKFLCVLFGCVPACCSRTIHNIRNLIVEKLGKHPAGKVHWPSVR